MQRSAGIYLLQTHSTYFGCPLHLSSGIHKIITTASAEAVVIVLCTPDDRCNGHSKYVEWFCSK
jgi:hypothetical protein